MNKYTLLLLSILLISFSCCKKNNTQTEPDLDFSWTGICITDSTISFKSNANSVDKCLWNFGDGNTSDLISPGHIYALADSYTVTLLNKTTKKTKTKIIKITQNPVYTALLGGVRVWHDTLTSYTPAHIPYVTAYPDTSFAVDIIDPLTISIGSDTLVFSGENSYCLSFLSFRANQIIGMLTYNFVSNSIVYEYQFRSPSFPWGRIYQTP